VDRRADRPGRTQGRTLLTRAFEVTPAFRPGESARSNRSRSGRLATHGRLLGVRSLIISGRRSGRGHGQAWLNRETIARQEWSIGERCRIRRWLVILTTTNARFPRDERPSWVKEPLVTPLMVTRSGKFPIVHFDVVHRNGVLIRMTTPALTSTRLASCSRPFSRPSMRKAFEG